LTGEPPPLPPRLAELAALTEPRELGPGERFSFPRAVELPEVQALAGDGWRPLEPAHVFGGLPAVWPVEHRCWVPDRLPRMSSSYCTGGAHRVVPWDESVWEEDAQDRRALVAECGLPAEPAGRIWLLRSPWPSLGLEVVLSILSRTADETLGNPGPVEITSLARIVLTWTEQQVWESWRGPRAEAARQWRELGRVGEEAADLVLRGLTPDHVAMLTDPGAAGLTEAQAIAWSQAVEELGDVAVRRIRGWRRIGLPADPPDQMEHLFGASPDEVARWLEDGFTLDDVSTLLGQDLETARSWRAAGFDASQTQRLLRADRTLTPEESGAFADAGIVDAAAIPWIECGFSAAEAKVWTDLDILPQEARVWRSVGKAPAVAKMHRADGGGPLPPDVQVGWTGYGTGRESRQYGVTDPPGTRGRIAHEQMNRPRSRWRGLGD